MQRSALCRSRRELSNEYLLAKIGVDTAENEPLEVRVKIHFMKNYSFASLVTPREQTDAPPLVANLLDALHDELEIAIEVLLERDPYLCESFWLVVKREK